jgi:hypothetical protein
MVTMNKKRPKMDAVLIENIVLRITNIKKDGRIIGGPYNAERFT